MALTDIDGGRLADNAFSLGKNLIINGAMQVAQRGTQTTGVTNGYNFICDRFALYIGTLGTWTIDQSTDAPNEFSNSFKATCTTADASPAAGDQCFMVQKFEAQNLQLLGFGTSGAKAITLSFWVKSNKTGNASVVALQSDNSNKLVSFQYSISSADTWEYKTIAIPADTSGLFNNDNGEGLHLEWWLNSGSNFSGGSHQATWSTYDATNRNVSNLGVGGATSDYFAITGVQLEAGSVATPFEHRSFGDELVKCQRYYQKTYNYADAPGTSTTQSPVEGNAFNAVFTRITWNFSTPMRAQPSCNIYSTSGTIDKFRNFDAGGSDVNGAISNTGENRAGLQCSNTGLTNGRHIGAHATASAEL